MEYEELTADSAPRKRDQLVTDGFAIVPGILGDPLLSELQTWSQDVFERVPVDPKYRYQGSDIHVYTEERWKLMDRESTHQHFGDPIVQMLLDHVFL